MATPKRNPGYGLFVLGAGFSRPAGLPLATELYSLVRQYIRDVYGADTKFARDVSNFIEYCSSCGITGQTEQSLDLELFMSYLDIEHYLGFRGSKTWSREGNEAQLMIRRAIGYVLNARTPPPDKLPDFYYRFAEQLSVHDTVLTLNYDLLLERALQHVGKPFRRFPYRYKSVNDDGGTLDSDTEELVLLKLHGSLDWFDDRHFLELRKAMQAKGFTTNLHSVFDDPSHYDVQPLVDGILPPGDALSHVHWIKHVDKYYVSDHGFTAPFILSPSHVKFVYAEPILGFWHGIGRTGAYNLGVSIIGFSMPPHDEYIRIGLYQVISNYGSWWDQRLLGNLKDYVRFVDFRETRELQDDFRSRYRFVSAKQARFYFGGFGPSAIDFLFDRRRSV